MSKTICVVLISSLALCGANKIGEVATKCDAISAVKVDAISNYEFTTIGKTIKTQDIGTKSVTFYDVDFEYSQDSILYVSDYNGDMAVEVDSWFMKSDENLYVEDVNFEKFHEGKLFISIDYIIDQKKCGQKFQL